MLNIITNRMPHEIKLVKVDIVENELLEFINISIEANDGNFHINSPIKSYDAIVVVTGDIKIIAGSGGITIDLSQVTDIWVDTMTGTV